MTDIRDAAEARLATAAGRTMRAFLRRVKAEYRPPSGFTAAPDDPITLGQVSSWWMEEVDETLMGEVLQAYAATYEELIGSRITATSMDAAREYLSRVRNRIGTDVAEDAFNRVRVATAQGLAQGWSKGRLSERVAAELGWTRNRDYWQGELDDIDSYIDELLDPFGKPGAPAREAARRNDPEIRSLQQDRAHARAALDADQSHWQSRADTIARTESTGATNHAANSALRDEGVSHKKWLAADDARTRPSHNEADGQLVPVGDPFLVGGVQMMNPGDPSAPAGETVNCRCSIVGEDLEPTSQPPEVEPTSWTNEEYFEYIESFENRTNGKILDSISEYRGEAYQPLNASLRNNKRLSAKSRAIAKDMTEAFDQIPPLSKPTRVYRGVDRGWQPPEEGIFVDKGFMSTSSDRDYVYRTFPGWVLDIDVPAGSRAIPVGAGEHELLFAPGTALRILSIDRREGIIRMEMVE